MASNILHKVLGRLRRLRKPPSEPIQKEDIMISLLASTYDVYKEYTMIPRSCFMRNLAIAQNLQGIVGSIVECGVWRGGMIGAFAKILGAEREYFLYDSFQGLPPASTIDGPAAIKWQSDVDSPGYFDNCRAEREFAESAMALSGAKHYKIIPGWFEDTLSLNKPASPIALLRLDCDWYSSTMTCLESLFDNVATGGLVILDDYYTWDGCAKALHAFLAKSLRSERIRQLSVGGCYLIKGEMDQGTNSIWHDWLDAENRQHSKMLHS